MTVKSNIDGEEESSDTMAQRITAAQSEQWKSHRFIDEDDHQAWLAYHKNLFVGAQSEAEDRSEVLAKLPKLLSALDDDEYLDFISAPRDAAKLSRSKKISRNKKGKGKETETGAVIIESDNSSTLSDSSGGEEEAVMAS